MTVQNMYVLCYVLVQCITLLRASAAAWNVRVMKFTRIAKFLLRVFRIT